MFNLELLQWNLVYRKWTFKTHTVIHIDKVTKIMVNSKYFPKSGIASDVGGIISANSKKNTVNERRMEEHNDTYKNSIFYSINTFSFIYYSL